MAHDNNVVKNPSNAGDDDNLWPDWNSAHGTGKDSRGDATDRNFDDIYAESRKGAAKRDDQRKETFEKKQKPAFAHDADSYQA